MNRTKSPGLSKLGGVREASSVFAIPTYLFIGSVAVMIVVGTNTGWHRLAELVNGSVAARLTRHQHRPVLVVPTDPGGFDHHSPSDPS